ncbi:MULTISPECIES: SRPBCC family protein [Paenibacillus]|uniref:ATPase n=1 Tax=Paenibacillus campinasensis TaxID=66347 RepID=A0A268EX11_9BACL|nr:MULTISPECIES: SRPBCC domain-containing protein [Paenibacillus]MUG66033.1 SRPBCC domain-containing protein [Paenibacillus campinasensis]PAD77655.1 ATPase [Paenibacillus campinasensis]PAK49798.1 ATPase [Paenibacillus sp. 7541]
MVITQETHIQADISLVWRAWTEADRIKEWFAPAAVIEPWQGGRFELYFNPANPSSMSTSGCTILKAEEPHLLIFEWKGPDPFAETMNHSGQLTSVEVGLEPQQDGTRVTLRHDGWKDSADWLAARKWHVEAWKDMLTSLKSRMESGEGILCCQ